MVSHSSIKLGDVVFVRRIGHVHIFRAVCIKPLTGKIANEGYSRPAFNLTHLVNEDGDLVPVGNLTGLKKTTLKPGEYMLEDFCGVEA